MPQGLAYRKRGFTLVELAIVLAVAGLMFVGLWRLLSSGNQQVRDQSAASTQQQLISATKAYLASSAAQTGVLAPIPANNPYTLLLPAAGTACNSTGTQAQQFTCFLPSGFNASTTNSYGQAYNIQILKDGSAAGTIPTTYSFMILTSGGDTIPDTSGGRISAFIGGDGGFIYSNNVCNAQTGGATNVSACGAYGTWAVNARTIYGFATTTSGTIASRTYVSPTAGNQFPWLARPLMPGDAGIFLWNTMTTDLYMGGTSNQTAGLYSNIYLVPPATDPGFVAGQAAGSINLGAPGATTGGGTIYMQGGTISGSGTSSIVLSGGPTAVNPLISTTIGGAPGCPVQNSSNPTNCPWTIQSDTINVTNLLNAVAIYAGTFIYQSSDARLKTDIHPLADPLTDVMKLKPVSFTLKSSGKEGLGVIAQDLEKVYPQLVTQGPGMKSVNYDGLIGPLIGSVQELKKENDELRQKLRAQEQRENRLEQEIKNGKTE